MPGDDRPRGKNLLARALKRIGALTDPKQTTTGKVFNAWERGMTSALERLAGNDTYLNFAGRMMEQSFLFQSEAIRSTEALLRAMRLPTTSQVDELQDEIRKLRDQNEALSQQLEVVLQRIEGQNQQQKAGVKPE